MWTVLIPIAFAVVLPAVALWGRRNLADSPYKNFPL